MPPMYTFERHRFIARDGNTFEFIRKKVPPIHPSVIAAENVKYIREFGVRVRNARFTEEYNCHGLTFAAKLGWFDQVRSMLASHGYKKVSECLNFDIDSFPSNLDLVRGDIVVYYHLREDNVTHTGVVWSKRVRNGKLELTILSKWGNVSEYFHRHDKVPIGYGRSIEIWTDRDI
jgi:hypothetical protein